MAAYKEYSNGEITIVWKPDLCFHSRNCVNGLPQVFDNKARPWINAEGAGSLAIIRQVNKCPSGALSYFMNETGKPLGDNQGAPTIEVSENGPLVIKGAIEIIDPAGQTTSRSGNTALCRCGASGKKPYCDGTHRKIDFKG